MAFKYVHEVGGSRVDDAGEIEIVVGMVAVGRNRGLISLGFGFSSGLVILVGDVNTLDGGCRGGGSLLSGMGGGERCSYRRAWG